MPTKIALSDILYGLLVFALALFILTFIGQRVIVSGSSMEPSFSNGDTTVVNKLAYRFGKPERFDVIVFNNFISYLIFL